MEEPDIVFLTSVWMPRVTVDTRGWVASPLRYKVMSKFQFACAVSTWFTFVSGIVVVSNHELKDELRGGGGKTDWE